MSRKHMLERGRRDPHPAIFSRIQVGVIGGRTSKSAGSAALLRVRFRLVDLSFKQVKTVLGRLQKPMGLVGASDSDRLTPLLTVNAYRPIRAVGVI